MNKNVPTPVAAAILATVIALVAWNAVRAARNDPSQCPRNVSGQYCLKCHTDAKTLQAMKDKRGD